MKKAFTLLELLIVVVVIAILIGVSFRILATSGDQEARAVTINRMQRLENAIGGYYAAFGGYPPVRLHASRNFFYQVDEQGIQQNSDEKYLKNSINLPGEWPMVEAACKAQPMAMRFPYRECDQANVKKVMANIKKRYDKGEAMFTHHTANGTGADAMGNGPNQISSKKSMSEWGKTQLFQFGLMSFLLPRYMLMMTLKSDYASAYDDFVQWGDNNTRPCRFEDGTAYDSWADLAKDVALKDSGEWERPKDALRVSLLPSQVITARWLANLEGICSSGHASASGALTGPSIWIYGIDISDKECTNVGVSMPGATVQYRPLPIYTSGDSQAGTSVGWSQAYSLDGITVNDGWENEFFYYSEPPHQGYRLWSSGPSMAGDKDFIYAGSEIQMTFPPWVPEKDIQALGAANARVIHKWKSTDIVYLSN